jgi:MEMO1 family protein
MGIREAYHAGSWYSSSGPTLAAQIDEWLANVPDDLPGIGKTPIPGARVVISPHAGYAYSGPCAAWAYRSLDLSKACVLPTGEGGVSSHQNGDTTDCH